METTEQVYSRMADEENKKGNVHESKKDYGLARICYENAAKFGSARGWTNLGSLYCGDQLGNPDLPKAYECFSKAAAGGHERGLFMQAKMLGRGEGVDRNIQKALNLLQPLVQVNFSKARELYDDLLKQLAESSAMPVKQDRVLNHQQLQGSVQIIPYEQLIFGQRIGAGAFGAVFKGTWQRRTVAIKKLEEGFFAKRDLKQELFDEAAALYQLNSPLVMHLWGLSFDEATGESAMVMEFAAYGSLDHLFKKQKLHWSVKISLSADVAMGLGYLHEKDILHRDLKAANILVDFTDNRLVAKIGDFGLAKKKRGNNTTVLNVNPHVIGTRNRLAQELRQNEKRPVYTKQSDVFSLGMLFVEMGTEDEPDLEKISPDTPLVLREQIDKCCSQDPSARPEAYAVAAALEVYSVDEAEALSTGLADSDNDVDGYARVAERGKRYLEYSGRRKSNSDLLGRTSDLFYARAEDDTGDVSLGYVEDADLYSTSGCSEHGCH